MLIARRKDQAKYPELWDGIDGAWYPGAGASGTRLYDLSGRDNHGTLTSGPTWADRQGGKAISFDGVDDFVQAPSTPAASSFSVVTHLTINVGAAAMRIAGNYSGGTVRGWGLFVDAGSLLNFFIFGAAGTVNTAAGVVPRGVSVCLAVVYSFSGSTCTKRQYIDGVLVDTAAGAVGSISTASAFLQIGKYNSAVSLLFAGSVHEFLEYDRALSDTEINLLARRPGIAYELAARKVYSLPSALSSARLRRILTGAT